MFIKRRNLSAAICAVLLFGGFGIMARAQFISDFGVSKTAYYDQTDDNTPALESFDPYEFVVYIDGNGQSDIDFASVMTPSGGGLDLSQTLFYFKDYATQSAMDAEFKSGTYTFEATDVDLDVFGEQLALSGNSYPSIPQVLNYSALQSINANADLTLHWLPFQGGTASDSVEVDIEGDDGTAFYMKLDGTASSVVIPTGSLTNGATYDLYLLFSKVVDVDSNDGLGQAVYARETYAAIKASSGTAITVTVTGYSLVPNGPFQVQVSGTPGATFALEGTTDFSGWTQVDSMVLTTGTGTLSDPNTAANPHRFYRVKAM